MYKVGDILVSRENPDKPIEREIVEVCDTGYTWKYPDYPNTFWSENSTDPFFVWGWRLKE